MPVFTFELLLSLMMNPSSRVKQSHHSSDFQNWIPAVLIIHESDMTYTLHSGFAINCLEKSCQYIWSKINSQGVVTLAATIFYCKSKYVILLFLWHMCTKMYHRYIKTFMLGLQHQCEILYSNHELLILLISET